MDTLYPGSGSTATVGGESFRRYQCFSSATLMQKLPWKHEGCISYPAEITSRSLCMTKHGNCKLLRTKGCGFLHYRDPCNLRNRSIPSLLSPMAQIWDMPRHRLPSECVSTPRIDHVAAEVGPGNTVERQILRKQARTLFLNENKQKVRMAEKTRTGKRSFDQEIPRNCFQCFSERNLGIKAPRIHAKGLPAGQTMREAAEEDCYPAVVMTAILNSSRHNHKLRLDSRYHRNES